MPKQAEEGHITYPRLWRHKKKGNQLKVLPWWECLNPIISDKDVVGSNFLDGGRSFKIGAIVQIGWMLENGNGVWIGTNFGVEKEFEDLGEWAPKKKPTKKKKTKK